MATRFTFHGLPCVELATGGVPLAASRPIQLLAYLAVSGGWQGRDHIAQLFWPDRPNKIARSNLRNLLCKLPDAAPFAPIESTRHALRLKAPSDLDDFEATMQRQDWQAAVRIGASELLQGFENSATEPYLLWLQAERETSLNQWKKAVQALLEQSSFPLEQREALAESWALRCPFDEDAVQARVSLAYKRHQAVAAEKIYRAFEARLRDELGVRPSVDLERFALHAPAQSALTSPASATTGPVQVTPISHTARPQLIGRRFELRQLTTLLKGNTAPLITITGPGGVGKSTLLSAFHRHWVDGGGADTFLVDVSAAPNAKAAVVAIASALSVTIPQGMPEEEALADALGERAWCLMIDGAEQAGLAAPLAQLLERCPQTRWLIASRQRLHLDNEHLLVLDGFPLPDADEADPELLGANDGVLFLADAIAKAGRPVDLVREAADMAAIVRAVEGLPLALRLLGKLTHLFSLHQLLDSVQHPDPGAMRADAVELGELLPSLLASFQRSWMSLSPPEQLVLARLAVFPAEFEIAAGRAVAKVELPLITSLVDRSLLRATGSGRLSLHAAIRSCVLAICPQPAADAVVDYLAYYTQRLRALASLARSKTVRPLHRFLDVEIVHVRRAWLLALKRSDYMALLSMQESVWFIDDGTSTERDFNARCAEAERLTRDDPKVPPALRAMLLAGIANDVYNQMRWLPALEHARHALRAARSARRYESTVLAHLMLFWTNFQLGNTEQSEALMGKVEALLGNAGEAEGLLSIHVLGGRALIALGQGNLETSLDHYARAVTIARQFEDSNGEFMCLMAMATAYHFMDMPNHAIGFEERALAVNASGQVDPARAARHLCAMTQWNLDHGNIERARIHIEQAAALLSSRPQTQILRLKVCLGRAAVFTAQGNLAAARQHLGELLNVISSDDVQGVSAATFVIAARWFRLAGDREACVEALRVVLTKPEIRSTFKIAQTMLRELGEDLPESTSIQKSSSDICSAAVVARQRLMQLPVPTPADVDSVELVDPRTCIEKVNVPN
jgi:DNA-binding SARP family transcriptional activator/tetratricopeptide (TPR) repeat protein